MNEWVRLDAEKLNTPQSQAIRGVNITVRMSPYDVPEAVRGYYDKAQRRFVIEFRYIDDEPLQKKQEGAHITLRIGRHSGRLYGIEADIDAMKSQAVDLNQAIDSLASLPRKRSRRENYEVAKKAIAEKEGEIFASLAAG